MQVLKKLNLQNLSRRENYSKEPTAGVASFNVSPASFGKYYSKLGCFCFEKQELKAGEIIDSVTPKIRA